MKIIRDTREKSGKGWNFSDQVVKKLDTGDYSIEGLEDNFCIERKGSLTEFARNLVEPRFEDELKRMSEMSHPFIILEFTEEQLIAYPKGVRLPKNLKAKIRLRGKFLGRRVEEIREKYPNIEIIFAGKQGRMIANDIFRSLNVEVPCSTCKKPISVACGSVLNNTRYCSVECCKLGDFNDAQDE